MSKKTQIADFPSPDYGDFLSLLQANKKRIFGYILAVMPQYSIAEDIMQDTVIRLWSKYSTFSPGTNFGAWGISIARYVIMEYRKKNKGMHISFDSQAMDNLFEPFVIYGDIDDRLEALRRCLKKMPERQLQIVQMRYSENLSIKEIALKVGRPIQGMYKAMTKVHYLLQECIEGTLNAWSSI